MNDLAKRRWEIRLGWWIGWRLDPGRSGDPLFTDSSLWMSVKLLIAPRLNE